MPYSLEVHMVKNLPAMQGSWVWSLYWEDSPGEGNGYPLQLLFLAWRILWTKEMGSQRVGHDWGTNTHTHAMLYSMLLHVTEWGPLGFPGMEASLSPISCRCWLKKDTQSESCKLSFIWEQNEDCSLGDSISDSFKKLLQRSNGGRQDYSVYDLSWVPKVEFKQLLIEGGAAKKSTDTRLKGPPEILYTP